MDDRSEEDPAGRERDRLLTELHALDREYFDGDVWRIRESWQLSLGPVYVRGRFASQRIAKIYATLCVACLLTGGLLAALSPMTELGTALVVGAIFAIGSFVGQWWALQIEREGSLHHAVFGEDDANHLRQLQRRRAELIGQIERISPGYFDRRE